MAEPGEWCAAAASAREETAMPDSPMTTPAAPVWEAHRDNAAAAWATLQQVRAAAPLVHNIANLVITNLTANMLLALGASQAMVENVEEAGELAAAAGAPVVNRGSMAAPRTEAMHAAAEAAVLTGRPWVLDPVA